ncbi:MAG: class I SAM-dependent methyltransferase [Methylocystis sp.]
MDDNFDLPRDVGADLLAFKQRIQQLDFEQLIRLEEQAAPRRPTVVRQSLWGKFNSLLISLARLTSTRRKVDALEDDVTNLRRAVTSVVESELTRLGSAIETIAVSSARNLQQEGGRLKQRMVQLEHRAAEFEHALRFERLTRQKAFTDFDRRLTLRATEPTSEVSSAPATTASELPTSVLSLLESFYYLLEERYRGTRDEIKQRLLVYRNDFAAARERTGVAGPIVDLGCGRGELVEVLRENGFQAIGVDSNDIQLESARQHGAAVVLGSALDYLRTLEDNSVLGVSGIHIVEHIPFPDLIRIMQQVTRVLKNGGVAIFETPNPRNLIVGATTFHFDPTHVRPLPPEVLQILLETVGFEQVETRELHPSDTLDYMVKHHNLDRHIAKLLYGPQDYAAIGIKG